MTASVTGAGGGIGGAFVDVLTRRGHDVIAQDLTEIANMPATLTGDLCDSSFLDEMSRVIEARDDLDTVVAAHGMAGAGRIEEVAPARARAIMAVNFESVVRLWERVSPVLEANRGCFVVVISQAGLVAEAGNGLYCASKFALTGWLRGVADHTGVRLRAVYPGGIRTPLLERALQDMAVARTTTYDAFTAQRYGDTPAGRIAEPTEMGSMLDWLMDLRAAGLVELAITGGEVLW